MFQERSKLTWKSKVLAELDPANAVARPVPLMIYNHSIYGTTVSISTIITSSSPTVSRVPMQLPQAVGFHEHQRTGELCCYGKVGCRVLDLHPSSASWSDLLLLLTEAEDVLGGRRALGIARRRALAQRRWRYRTFQDVRILLRNLAECTGIDTEILRDYFKRRMGEPIREHERRPQRVEVPIGENEKDLKALVQCLDTMRYTWREAAHSTSAKLYERKFMRTSRCLDLTYLLDPECPTGRTCRPRL